MLGIPLEDPTALGILESRLPTVPATHNLETQSTVQLSILLSEAFLIIFPGLLSRGSVLPEDSADHRVFWQSSPEQAGKHHPRSQSFQGHSAKFQAHKLPASELQFMISALHFARRPISHEPAICAMLTIPGRCKTRSHNPQRRSQSNPFDKSFTRVWASHAGAPHPTRILPAEPPASNAMPFFNVDSPRLGAILTLQSSREDVKLAAIKHVDPLALGYIDTSHTLQRAHNAGYSMQPGESIALDIPKRSEQPTALGVPKRRESPQRWVPQMNKKSSGRGIWFKAIVTV